MERMGREEKMEMAGDRGEYQVIRDHRELGIYQKAFEAAMEIFQLSKKFPVEERYSLTDQVRRSSRSVCANLAEAWRKHRYEAAFVAKLNNCVREAFLKGVAEATETQTWLEFAIKCHYLEIEPGNKLLGTYNQVIAGLVTMIDNHTPWLIKP